MQANYRKYAKEWMPIYMIKYILNIKIIKHPSINIILVSHFFQNKYQYLF